MLHAFILANRVEIVSRAGAMAAARWVGSAVHDDFAGGTAVFLDQLTTRLENAGAAPQSIAASATANGSDMMRRGFTVAEVVQGYGDVCQSITTLALERAAVISVADFRTLNACLDEATAEAVSEFGRETERATSERGLERLGFLAHELRNMLNRAKISFELLRQGSIGIGGSTGAVLGRSLNELGTVVERALAEVRLDAGVMTRERTRIADLIHDVEVVASFEAARKHQTVSVRSEDADAMVDIDRHTISSAIGNLVQNALKFTPPGGAIAIRTRVSDTRVLVEVSDQCGGLPPGGADALFRSFEQRSTDRSGLGLGLGITRRAVEANGGTLHAHDSPEIGCVFTIDLPKASAAPQAGPATPQGARG